MMLGSSEYFFLKNYHLVNLAILPFLPNSTNESIIHSAFNGLINVMPALLSLGLRPD
jgi:hypothetical protein